MRGPTDRRCLECKTESEFGIRGAQHSQRRRGDLGTDAVAFQHQNVDRTGRHETALAALLRR